MISVCLVSYECKILKISGLVHALNLYCLFLIKHHILQDFTGLSGLKSFNIYKGILFVVAVVLVDFFPKGGQFKFEFQKGSLGNTIIYMRLLILPFKNLRRTSSQKSNGRFKFYQNGKRNKTQVGKY